jgi:regulator of replication initiation timing
VFVKFNRNSRSADADLRESYRQRLTEILEAGKPGGGGGLALPPETSPLDMPQTTEKEIEPVVLVRTEEPATASAEIGQVPLEEAVAAAVPPQPEQSETLVTDAFDKAAERVTESLAGFWSSVMQSLDRQRQAGDARLQAACNDLTRVQGEVAELRDLIGAQRRSTETQVLEALARIDKRLEALDKAVQSQAEAVARLISDNQRLEQAQQAVRQRLDTQADAVRDLTSAVGVQQGRWAQYRSAVEKLREITDVPSVPVQLPTNL